MAFIAGTQVFTDGGWKKIEDISGNDKVLVRNFIGDAELVQPFALRKRQYEGPIFQVGAKSWSFSVTPGHIVVYNSGEYGTRPDYKQVPVEILSTNNHDRVQRKFKYLTPDNPPKEVIKVYSEFGDSSVTIDPVDWYSLVAYALSRANILSRKARRTLYFNIREDHEGRDIEFIGGILDKYGIEWHIKDYSPRRLYVSNKNTLAARMINRLGSTSRKEMRLPDRMVFQSSKSLTRILIETLIEASKKPSTERGNVYIYTTANRKLVDTLTIMGTLGGYSMRPVLKREAGSDFGRGVTTRDLYNLHISNAHDTYDIRFINKSMYSGPVYEIDLFDGQVYIRERSMPVWVNPK